MEKMSDFFAARVEGYDEHMLGEVEGCREAYAEMARRLPESTASLLDLGCGTGLELEPIFKRFPDISVTGIDLTAEMLDKCREKFPGKRLELICGDYFQSDFGVEKFDAAVSFQTMHHFAKDRKVALYRRLRDSLKPGGVYLECDYMVDTQAEEDKWFAEFRRLGGTENGEFYHFDMPCTVENQLKMYAETGFVNAEIACRVGNTTLIIVYKE